MVVSLNFFSNIYNQSEEMTMSIGYPNWQTSESVRYSRGLLWLLRVVIGYWIVSRFRESFLSSGGTIPIGRASMWIFPRRSENKSNRDAAIGPPRRTNSALRS